MIFINPQGDYPRHIGDLKLAASSWSVGDQLPDGWIEVTPNDPESVPENHVAYELAPEEVDGVWVRVWATRPMTEEELEATKPENILRRQLENSGLTPEQIDQILAG